MQIPPLVTAHTGFVGLRSPYHEVARSLLRSCDPVPIAAPSANKFGHVSPTRGEHVMKDLGDVGDLLILEKKKDVKHSQIGDVADVACAIGIESTVCGISPRGDEISILRCGAIGSQAMRTALSKHGVNGVNIFVKNEISKSLETRIEKKKQHAHEKNVHAEENSEGAIAPGQLLKHYAPNVQTFVVSRCTLNELKSLSLLLTLLVVKTRSRSC